MRTILVIGVSNGLGRAVAEEALVRGQRVVGTLRQKKQQRDFEALTPCHAVGHVLDVTTASIRPLVQSVGDTFGIDVLVNNAGLGLQGVVEEYNPDALRRQFEVNLFGLFVLIQAILPKMRQRRAAHI